LPSTAETAFFKKHLRAFRPDAILVNYCWLSPLLTGLAELPTAILTNDVVSQRLACTPGLVPDPATPEGEANLLAHARHILAISEDDAAVFRHRLPQHSVIITPKAAEPQVCTNEPAPDRVLFVGGINHFNREGIQWFLAEVWPLVMAKNPRAQLHVCGGISGVVSNAPAGVVRRGRVPNLAVEYAEASAVIVPLLHGTGVKIKLVEAASYGKAIVTTPVGLQGLGFLRSAVVEAALPADFADGVVALLVDPLLRQKLSQNILSQVTKHLSREGSYGPVCHALSRSSS
jgi:glycosyltransferase involved in cell wall biosynthesis